MAVVPRIPAAVCGAVFLALAGLAWADNAALPPVKRIGVLTDNYPFSFRREDGAMAGFAYELVQEIEAAMGLRFERVEGRTREIHELFRQGQLDLMQAYARFPEREREMDFSVPYARMTGAILVHRAEARIGELADLRGRRVAVHRGSLGETVLKRAGLEDSIVPIGSVEEAMRAVDRGEVDATLVSRLSGLAMAHHLGLQSLKAVEGEVPGYTVNYCLAVQEGDRELLAQVNEGLAILVRTGRFDEIYRKWFGHVEPAGYSKADVMMAVAIGLSVALLVTWWAVLRQRRLQARLVRQAEEFRAVFDGAHDALLVLDADETVRFRVRLINPAGVRLLNLAAAPSSGARLDALLGADAELEPRIRALAAAGGVQGFEYERPDRQGWWWVSVGPISGATLVSLSDTTEQVRARIQLQQQEKRLMQAQKLEAIGTLAGGVAHDFNNVLTGILGHTELALLTLPAERPEIENLRQVMQAGQRARSLVQQILAFSRRSEPVRKPVKVVPLVKETAELLRVMARGVVQINLQAAGNVPAILADPGQAHQVLMNIGTNAVQALRGGTGGQINFGVEAVEVRPDDAVGSVGVAPGWYVRIGIQDNGPGMSPDVVARIFEPFFTTKAPGEGTGLGLSVVHGIVQKHGGAVTVYSEPGRGSLFTLYFPVAPQEVEAGTLAAREPPRGQGEQVMLVDDDALVLHAVRRMLMQLGYQVAAFERPEAALAEFLARSGDYAVVFTDLMMPGMNGLQLVRRIQALKPAQPIVVASGFFTASEEVDAANLRVARLHKPVSMTAVGEAVAACLPRNRLG